MKKKLLPFCFIWVLGLYPVLLQSQNAPQWLNCTSGLNVKAVLETEDGILWTATSGGLIREELATGNRSFFNRGNSPIPSNDIRDIALDAEGNLWLSTNLGTAYLDGEEWVIFYEKSGLLANGPQNQIVLAELDSLHWWTGSGFNSIVIPTSHSVFQNNLAVNPVNGDVWLSLYTYGEYWVLHYNGQDWKLYHYQNSPLPWQSPTTNPLLVDRQGKVWIGTTEGLYLLDQNTWTYFDPSTTTFPAGEVTALGLDDQGAVWASIGANYLTPAVEASIVKIEAVDRWSVIPLPVGIQGTTKLNALYPANSNRLYIGSVQDGLWRYRSQGWEKVETSVSPLTSNLIFQIFIDGRDSWIKTGIYHAYENKTLLRFNADGWHAFEHSELPFTVDGSSSDRILTKAPNGDLWFHADRQLFSYDGNQWSAVSLPDIHPEVEETNSYVHFTPSGHRWILDKWTSFIFRETDQGWITYPWSEHGAVSGSYEKIYTHPTSGDFWLTSRNGISRFDGQQWYVYRPKDMGMQNNLVYDLVIDRQGVVWASCFKGLLRFDGQEFQLVTNENTPIPNLYTRGLVVDDQNRLWVGLMNALARFDGSDWEVFDNRNSGLPNGSIEELYFDKAGNLWIGSERGGLGLYHPNGLDLDLVDELHTGIKTPVEKEGGKIKAYPVPLSNGQDLHLVLLKGFTRGEETSFHLYNSLGQLEWQMEKVLTETRLRIPAEAFEKASGIHYLQVQQKNTNAALTLYLE